MLDVTTMTVVEEGTKILWIERTVEAHEEEEEEEIVDETVMNSPCSKEQGGRAQAHLLRRRNQLQT